MAKLQLTFAEEYYSVHCISIPCVIMMMYHIYVTDSHMLEDSGHYIYKSSLSKSLFDHESMHETSKIMFVSSTI